MNAKILGQRIEIFRRGQGMNQLELAQAVGYSRASISNVENGRQVVLFDTLLKIAEVCGTDIHGLLFGQLPERSKMKRPHKYTCEKCGHHGPNCAPKPGDNR